MPTELVLRDDRCPSLLPICLLLALYALVLIASCGCGDIAPELTMVAAP